MRKIIKSVMFGLGLALTAPAVAAGAAKSVAVPGAGEPLG